MNNCKFVLLSLLVLISLKSYSIGLNELIQIQRFNIDNMEYLGGFRIPAETYGESNATYAEGVITLGKDGKSLFIVGHAQQQAIAEFSIPPLVKSMNVKDFNYATKVQNFYKLFSRPATGNPQSMDRVGGMEYINDQLFVNTYVYYDASGASSDTTMVIKSPHDLANSKVAGYHRLSAGAHSAGWMTQVPNIWQAVLGGTYIAGSSSGRPIISRWSVGPSAFTFDPVTNNYGALSPGQIGLTTLMDFSLEHPLGFSASTGTVDSYIANASGSAQLWTHLSRAAYGFIVPGTRTYMTIGVNGGMETGVGYKIEQDNGVVCGGHCAYSVSDYDNYYWLWDINDLLDVKSGKVKPYDVMPYEYGKLNKPLPSAGYTPILGASFDSSENILYLSLERGDELDYGWAPSIVAFKINVPAAPSKLSTPKVSTKK